MAKPFVTPVAIVVTENYIVMLIYDENSEPAFVGPCQVLNANVLVMGASFRIADTLSEIRFRRVRFRKKFPYFMVLSNIMRHDGDAAI